MLGQHLLVQRHRLVVRVVGQVEVLFALGFSRLMLRERIRGHEIAGLLLVTAGVVLALLGALG